MSNGSTNLTDVVTAGGGANQLLSPDEILIDFNDPVSLRALPDAARGTFADGYTEDGMTFIARVDPPDPALGGQNYSHYHLAYENPDILTRIVSGDRTIDAANQPRNVSPHAGDAVIQLTYDPNNDGVPDPFNLISIEVLSGSLNLGVRDPTGIGVYNNLGAGFRWFPIDADNLTRATLEATGSIFSIDNIVIEPLPLLPAEATSEALTDVPAGTLTPELHESVHAAIPEPGAFSLVGQDAPILG